MSRIYTQLECGCLISCDGGGGLYPGCDGKNCKVSEYSKKHKFVCGYCIICESSTMKEAVKKYGTKAEKRKWLEE